MSDDHTLTTQPFTLTPQPKGWYWHHNRDATDGEQWHGPFPSRAAAETALFQYIAPTWEWVAPRQTALILGFAMALRPELKALGVPGIRENIARCIRQHITEGRVLQASGAYEFNLHGLTFNIARSPAGRANFVILAGLDIGMLAHVPHAEDVPDYKTNPDYAAMRAFIELYKDTPVV